MLSINNTWNAGHLTSPFSSPSWLVPSWLLLAQRQSCPSTLCRASSTCPCRPCTTPSTLLTCKFFLM